MNVSESNHDSLPLDGEPGTFLRRSGALLYDALVTFAVLFAASVPFVIAAGPDQTPAIRLVFRLYLLGVLYAFFAWFWIHGGQTIGMRAWQLRVVADNGAALTWRQASLRFAAALLGVLLAGLGWLWILADAEKRGWHDRLSGTRVVRLRSGGAAQQIKR